MKKLAASALAGGVFAAGLIAAPAFAADGVTVAYACNKATFTNNTQGTVSVNYGTANSDDAKNVQIPAKASRTVTSKNTNFGFTATDAKGKELLIVQWPGVDLTAKCSSGQPTKSATAKPTKPAKQQNGGLAKTGV